MSTVFFYAFTLVTIGLISIVVLDKLILQPKRVENLAIAASLGQSVHDEIKAIKTPKIIKIAYEYWHWILIIYLVRAFGFESMSIPSSSMLPSIKIGEQLIVNKFSYGLYDPLFRHNIAEFGPVERGEVVVFRSPEHPDTDYIKRVIGVPGDIISYNNKSMSITHCSDKTYCTEIEHSMEKNGNDYVDSDGSVLEGYDVSLEGVKFEIVLTPKKNERLEELSVEVPPNHYFVMGDNRDNSQDSRHFGVIGKRALVGKPLFSWIQLNKNEEGLGYSIGFDNAGAIQPR